MFNKKQLVVCLCFLLVAFYACFHENVKSSERKHLPELNSAPKKSLHKPKPAEADELLPIEIFRQIPTQDYNNPGTSRIVKQLVRNAKPGMIILLHDSGRDRKQTVAAIDRVMTILEVKGYRFQTVSRILKNKSSKVKPK